MTSIDSEINCLAHHCHVNLCGTISYGAMMTLKISIILGETKFCDPLLTCRNWYFGHICTALIILFLPKETTRPWTESRVRKIDILENEIRKLRQKLVEAQSTAEGKYSLSNIKEKGEDGDKQISETNRNENDQNVAISTADIGLQTSENDLNSMSVHSLSPPPPPPPSAHEFTPPPPQRHRVRSRINTESLDSRSYLTLSPVNRFIDTVKSNVYHISILLWVLSILYHSWSYDIYSL